MGDLVDTLQSLGEEEKSAARRAAEAVVADLQGRLLKRVQAVA